MSNILPLQLIDDLTQRGFVLVAGEDRLRFSPPTLPQTERESLAQNKDAILALLRGGKVCHDLDAPPPSSATLLSDLGIRLRYVDRPEEAQSIIERLKETKGAVGFDIETAKLPQYAEHPEAGLTPHLSQVRLAQFYAGGTEAYVFDLVSIPISFLAPLAGHRLVAHNAKFEIMHLLHAGIELVNIDCTMLMENARANLVMVSLADLAADRLHWHLDKGQQCSDWAQRVLSRAQVEYAAVDAVVVWYLYHHLMPDLIAHDRIRLYDILRGAQLPVARLECNGFAFDVATHATMVTEWEGELITATKEAETVLGEGVDLGSPKQIAEWLQDHLPEDVLERWPRTEKGQLQTGYDALSAFPDLPAVKPLLGVKRLQKLTSTYGHTLAARINPVTERLHSDFKIVGTVTGRMSSSEPNLQQAPSTKKEANFRKLFKAPDGRQLIVADLGQIEPRVLAALSGDQAMAEIFARGEDIYSHIAEAVTGVGWKDVHQRSDHGDKVLRNLGKVAMLALLYGQGPDSLAEKATAAGYPMTRREAEAAQASILRRFPSVQLWRDKTTRSGRIKKKVQTYSGRERDFRQEGCDRIYTCSLNTPIQGTAAELLLLTLQPLDRGLNGIDAKLVNVVHDECVLEASIGDAKKAELALEKAMTDAFRALFPGAPLTGLLAIKVCDNWAEGK